MLQSDLLYKLCIWVDLNYVGKKGIVCIKRTSEVAGIGEGTSSEETGHIHTTLHASDDDGSSSSSRPKGWNG